MRDEVINDLVESYQYQNEYHQVYSVILYSASAVAIPISLFCAVIILTSSSGLWTNYKFVLLSTLLWTTAAAVLSLIYQPIPLLPHFALLNVGGPFRGIRGANGVLFSVGVFILVMICGSIWLSFLFYYLLVCHSRDAEWIKRRTTMAGLCLVQAVVALLLAISFYLTTNEDRFSKEAALTSRDRGYLIEQYDLITANFDGSTFMKVFTVEFIIFLIVWLASILFMYARAWRFSHIADQQTKKICSRNSGLRHLLFRRVLLANLAPPLLLFMLPMIAILSLSSLMPRFATTSWLCMLFGPPASVLPLAYSLLYLILVKPYRRAIGDIVHKAKRFPHGSNSSVAVSTIPTIRANMYT